MNKQNKTFWFTLSKKGISLIVLVITILVMIVLAGATIFILSNSGILERANEARFKNSMQKYIEELSIFITNKLARDGTIDVTTIDVSLVTNGENQNLKNIISSVKREHIKYLSIEDGLLVFNIPENAGKQDILYASYACEIGVKVANIENCSDIKNINRKAYLKGDFNTTTGVNDPDLTGFNIAKTRYVSYTPEGKIVFGDTIDKAPPTNWYSYTNSGINNKWANIAVFNNVDVSYFVWVPKYEYKVESNVTTVNFISKSTITASEGYKIPEAFSWDMTEEGGSVVALSGFWMSKYKVSSSNDANTNFSYKVVNNKITVTTTTTTTGNLKYAYLIADNEETPVEETISTANTHEFSVSMGNIYDIYVLIYQTDGSGNIINHVGTCKKKIDTTSALEPDLTGFNVEKTRYISYDQYGKEIEGNKVSGTAPSDWYDYANNIWANIKIFNDQNLSRFVWIPRYEYRTYKYNGTVKTDINYIEKTKMIPTEGYKIPEAFTWDMTEDGGNVINLAGFWMSKYKVSENNKYMINITYKVYPTHIDVAVEHTSGTPATGTLLYEYYITEKGKDIGAPVANQSTNTYTYTNIIQNKTYDILVKVYNIDASGNVISYIGECEKYVYAYTPGTPTLAGFEPTATKYITWDSENVEVEGNYINEVAPENWYDYTNNTWANVKTMNGTLASYFTWIPRYEYRTYYYNNILKTDANYIPITKVSATDGYKIPEAFTWNMTEEGGNIINLAGFWMSKYKVSANP